MTRGNILASSLALFLLGGLALSFSQSITGSRHNLSVSGPGTVKAASEEEVCLFCHTPHGAGPEAPLWNRSSSGATYIPYTSSTAIAAPGQPSGASKLCLSCHDGTIALGMVKSRGAAIPVTGGGTVPPGSTRLGTSLADDHPVSFPFTEQLRTQHGELVSPSQLTGAVKLDTAGNVQCTSCHDPHDDRFGKFLVIPNQGSALCTTCHAPTGWGGAVHRSSPATWNGAAPDPWPHSASVTVADNGCENCHRPHNAQAPQRLLTFAKAEQGCLACHNGHVGQKNVEADFGKLSVHPVAGTEVHDPKEDLLNPPRHAECADCHDPHSAAAGGAALPRASGALLGVRGVSASGAALAEVTFEYELCFRCHADSTSRGASQVKRQVAQTNTRVEFSLSNQSHHAVLGAGKNPDVPSLISPYTVSSVISCTSCHNSNSGPGAGGTGPNGPHGSVYTPILERQLALTDGAESAASYALCYKCHSRTSILGNQSFRYHNLHIASARTACTTCHDPHGVAGKPHLINFNTDRVTPASGGRLEFVDGGTFRGSCYLNCHGHGHNPESY